MFERGEGVCLGLQPEGLSMSALTEILWSVQWSGGQDGVWEAVPSAVRKEFPTAWQGPTDVSASHLKAVPPLYMTTCGRIL